MEITVLSPTGNEPKEITKDDVWGTFEDGVKTKPGMIVAHSKTVCPIWKDKLGFKDVTVICEADQEEAVIYWLEYVHGGGCITNAADLKSGKVALRSEYMAW